MQCLHRLRTQHGLREANRQGKRSRLHASSGLKERIVPVMTLSWQVRVMQGAPSPFENATFLLNLSAERDVATPSQGR